MSASRRCRPRPSVRAEGYDRAYKAAVEKFDAVHRLTEKIAPDKIELALTAADVRRIDASGRKVALIGVENGYPIGTDIARVKEFYDRGARYMSLAHNGHSQLSDSNTGEAEGWKWNGLSPLGKQVIAEMNRVGIMIDVSHPSKESMMQALQLSKAPIIASHSAARALCNHSRNMDDEQLLALKKNGGVVQTVAFAAYVKSDRHARARRGAGRACARSSACRRARRSAAAADAAAGAVAARRRLQPRRRSGPRGRLRCAPQGRGRARRCARAVERRAARRARQARRRRSTHSIPPLPRATVKDFVDHIDYIVKKIGIDHVGISSDFDGGGGVDGWNDASETFNVTLELVRRGYTEAADREDLERQPAARHGPGGEGGGAVPEEMSRTISAEQQHDRAEPDQSRTPRGERIAAGALRPRASGAAAISRAGPHHRRRQQRQVVCGAASVVFP